MKKFFLSTMMFASMQFLSADEDMNYDSEEIINALSKSVYFVTRYSLEDTTLLKHYSKKFNFVDKQNEMFKPDPDSEMTYDEYQSKYLISFSYKVDDISNLLFIYNIHPRHDSIKILRCNYDGYNINNVFEAEKFNRKIVDEVLRTCPDYKLNKPRSKQRAKDLSDYLEKSMSNNNLVEIDYKHLLSKNDIYSFWMKVLCEYNFQTITFIPKFSKDGVFDHCDTDILLQTSKIQPFHDYEIKRLITYDKELKLKINSFSDLNIILKILIKSAEKYEERAIQNSYWTKIFTWKEQGDLNMYPKIHIDKIFLLAESDYDNYYIEDGVSIIFTYEHNKANFWHYYEKDENNDSQNINEEMLEKDDDITNKKKEIFMKSAQELKLHIDHELEIPLSIIFSDKIDGFSIGLHDLTFTVYPYGAYKNMKIKDPSKAYPIQFDFLTRDDAKKFIRAFIKTLELMEQKYFDSKKLEDTKNLEDTKKSENSENSNNN